MPIYKKVPKNASAIQGNQEISLEENPLLSPCVISLAAMEFLRFNTGVMTHAGLRFSRVRTRKDNASRILVDDMDVTFLTAEGKSSPYKDIDTDIIPFVEQILRDKPSIEKLSKIFRNVNIISYCLGDERVNSTIRNIRSTLEKNGYTPENIDSILKNIVVFAFAKDSSIDPAVTSYNFIDINDKDGGELPSHLVKATRQSKENGNPDGIYIFREKNSNKRKICFDGNGRHTIKYMEKGGIIPCIVATLVTGAVENSRRNHKSAQLVSYNQEEALRSIEDLIVRVKNGEKEEDILASIDRNVYQDLPHAKDEDLALVTKIDQVADILLPVKKGDTRSKKYRENLHEFSDIAGSIFSQEQKKYISTGKKVSNIRKGRAIRVLSDEQREILLHCIPYINPTKEEELIPKIEEIASSYLVEREDDNPRIQVIKEMIECAKNYDNNTEILYQDKLKVEELVKRMVEIASDGQLAAIITLDKNSRDLFNEASLSDEDREKITAVAEEYLKHRENDRER